MSRDTRLALHYPVYSSTCRCRANLREGAVGTLYCTSLPATLQYCTGYLSILRAERLKPYLIASLSSPTVPSRDIETCPAALSEDVNFTAMVAVADAADTASAPSAIVVLDCCLPANAVLGYCKGNMLQPRKTQLALLEF